MGGNLCAQLEWGEPGKTPPSLGCSPSSPMPKTHPGPTPSGLGLRRPYEAGISYGASICTVGEDRRTSETGLCLSAGEETP